MRKHNQQYWRTSTLLQKNIPLTLYSRKGCERVVCERWVGDRNRLQHIDPKFLCIVAALLPHSAGLLNQGPEGPSPLSEPGSHCLELQLELQLQLTPTSWLQLTQAVCGTSLYNCLTSTCFLWASICTEFNPSTGQGDIFDRMHLFLDWQLDRGPICYISVYLKQWSQDMLCFLSLQRLRMKGSSE